VDLLGKVFIPKNRLSKVLILDEKDRSAFACLDFGADLIVAGWPG